MPPRFLHGIRSFAAGLFFALAVGGSPPARAAETQGDRQVAVHNWPDYIAPAVLEKFTRETGINVSYSTFSENDELEAKLLSGRTGFDVVFPSATPFFARQVKAGLFQKLDFSKIPNAKGLDREIMTSLEKSDPGNRFAVPYMMYASGFGYNVDLVGRAMPDAPRDSWAMLFDPVVLGQFKECGVSIRDTPVETLSAFLIYKGEDAGRQSITSMRTAMQSLKSLRPFYQIGAQTYIDDLAQGSICVAHGYVGDLVQAREKGRKNTPPQDIVVVIPREGGLFGIDVMAVPADAPHPDAAHAFVNFILRPDIIAEISNETGYANAVPASRERLNPAIANDPAIYVPAHVKAKLTVPPLAGNREYERTQAREWARFRMGRN
ncbi:MAG: extracellular solute-binding protein [Magnetospirillum sp. WYHS-4]